MLGLRCSNKSGKGGVVAQLKLETPSGTPVIVETDASWLVLDKSVAGWDKAGTPGLPTVPATVVAKLGGGPWTGLTAAKFEQIAALPPAEKLVGLPENGGKNLNGIMPR